MRPKLGEARSLTGSEKLATLGETLSFSHWDIDGVVQGTGDRTLELSGVSGHAVIAYYKRQAFEPPVIPSVCDICPRCCRGLRRVFDKDLWPVELEYEPPLIGDPPRIEVGPGGGFIPEICKYVSPGSIKDCPGCEGSRFLCGFDMILKNPGDFVVVIVDLGSGDFITGPRGDPGDSGLMKQQVLQIDDITAKLHGGIDNMGLIILPNPKVKQPGKAEIGIEIRPH